MPANSERPTPPVVPVLSGKPTARIAASLGSKAPTAAATAAGATKVELHSYNPQWVRQYEHARVELTKRLGSIALDIQHVGSTAVPEMIAKPIIDVLLITPDLEALDNAKHATTELGYAGLGEYGIAGRRYFTRRGNHQYTINLHAFEAGHRHAINLLLLRDFLRSNRSARERYNECKRNLATAHPTNPGAYQAGKQGAIEWLLARATGQR